MSTKTSSSSVSNSRNNEKDKGRIKINMTLCKYEVVKKIVKDRGWKMVTDENDKAGIASCNLHWIDVPDFLATWKILLPYQKVNHFPGMSNLARKSKLARNFERMRKLFPEEYDFCPRTWILPFDMNDFQQQFNADGSSSKTFIIKPDHSCQGRGVFLTKNLHQVSKQDILVAQSYLTKPLLIE
jgi:tubulin polyglutamylase TTLL6/13